MIFDQIKEKSQDLAQKFKLEWKFTTPAAPHQGGIYEEAGKLMKYHLIRIIGDSTLTFDVYSTVLSQVEAMINSRPLTRLDDDQTTLNVLTPGHFLIGEPLINIPDERDFIDVPMNRLDRWELTQKVTQLFWSRWHREYISFLINRTKWLNEKKNFKVDDVVIMKDVNLPPLKWKLGRIIKSLPGNDGLGRSVIVKTNNGIFKRPIVKIGLLLDSDEN